MIRLTLRKTLAELVLGSVLALIVSFIVQLAASKIHMRPGTYLPDAVVSLASAIILIAGFAILAYQRGYRFPLWTKFACAASALSGLATIVLAVSLQGTRFYLGGTATDNTFRLQYMERMASSSSIADVNYHALAPYYPGGWFWLGGRFANLFGFEGWAAYKPYAITWVALTAVIAFVLWSLVVSRRVAFLGALATLLAGFLSIGVEEPYAWPSAAWLLPIAVLALRLLRRRDRTPNWPLVLIGCYLGFAGVTYTLHCGFGVLVVVAFAAWVLIREVRCGQPARAVALRLLVRCAIIGVVAFVLVATNWAPFILAGGLGKPNLAARYLPADSAYFPMPFGPGSLLGVLCLAGLVWLLVRFRGDGVAAALLGVGALVYVWFALSMAFIAAHTTLLAFRFIVILDVVLMVGGVFGAIELIRYGFRFGWPSRKTVRTVGFALAVAGALTLTQTSVGTALSEPVDTAESSYYPTGENANGERNSDQDGALSGDLISAIDRLSARKAEDNIVLSTVDDPMLFRPYWGFQQSTPQYANPLAQYDQRSNEVREWSQARGSDDLLRRMADSQFEQPNVFVLKRADGGAKLAYSLKSDSFPRSSPVRGEDVYFDAKVFDSSRFSACDVGPYRVIALH